MTRFLAELRRRNVIRMAGLYLVGAWLMVQVADTLLPIFHTPDWVLQALVVLLALGFVPALVFSWVFELTPEGLKRESEIDRSSSTVDHTARKLDVVVIVLLLAVGGLMLWGTPDVSTTAEAEAGRTGGSTESPAVASPGVRSEAAPAARTIAVLPFENLSSDPEQGYFADGLTEEILNALASVRGLSVTARTSSFYYKDKDLPVDEIGQRLGVEHLLEGSVRRSGDQLRVTAQLVRARDGFHLWSQIYDRAYADAFAVQGDIATQVASALGILLDEGERSRMNESGARSPQAYALFARGFELYRAAHNDAPQIPTLIEANRFFDQAVQAAPNLWAAHYHSADLYAHILLYLAGGNDPSALPEDEVARAASELRARLQAASSTAPNDAARDFIQLTYQLLSDDWRGLSALMRRAYGHAEACGFDQWMHIGVPFGMAREAEQFFRRGMQCNALDDSNWHQFAHSALYAGDPQTALDMIDRGLAIPELALARHRLHGVRVAALLAAGRIDDARAELLRGGQAGRESAQSEAWLAAFTGDVPQLDALRAAMQGEHPLRGRELEVAAIAGDRDTANRLASAIDAKPTGPMTLLVKTYFCLCGAPFDIEATPILAARMKEADLPWPPTPTIAWPLKGW